jgi:ATP-dependent helicase/nuclease subunit A
MKRPRVIPPVVTERQLYASDPQRSAWVAANAGSGKTHVLAQRVIRLLLDRVDPSRILCITFTKAAAANMSNRVFDELRRWTLLDDAALDEAMGRIGVGRVDSARRERARQLFALALETPGGLKVQTIHAFCTQLLHLFPFEANVAARFEVLDEASEAQLLERLTLGVMQEAAEKPDSDLGRALSAAILAAADMTFRDRVRDTIRARDRLTQWVANAGGMPQAMAQLSRALGIEPDDTAARLAADFFDASLIDAGEWPAVADALAQGSKADAQQGALFAALGRLTGAARLEAYIDIFCTRDRSKTKDRLVTKAIRDAHPALAERLQRECSRVWTLLLRRRAIEARDRSAALFTIAHAVIARFRAEKDRRGLLDYEDLIDKTLHLLRDQGAAWVHYKLDRGIDHVLIDEAQDTSPKQWDIVKALTAEFFAGKGAQERRRTIFAVGDEKQSIFSFQGAVPRAFADMRMHFETAHRRAELAFIGIEFKHSFRSGPNVLGAVDTVFDRVEAHTGLTADPVAPRHESLPEAAPGLVEIWELEKPADREAVTGWKAPFDTQDVTSPVVTLASRIAGSVAAWQRQGRRPGDVLVLVRRRALFEAVIRALKNAGIPVAGADRLVLTEHIAVMDLLALADALLLPEDDLALATVLKSPLFGFNDDNDLFPIASDRGPLPLRDALRRRSEPRFAQAAARLDTLARLSRERSPFDFYAHLLGAEQGRRRFLERLGHEANDALDEFLSLALDYERRETPSLQGFIAFMRAAQSDVKRDMEIVRDEVRVMTVHGAKGLEAPIVILADTTTPPQGWHPPALLPLPPEDAPPETPDRMVWARGKDHDAGAMSGARDSARRDAENEYRRLLYVAMTRAIDRLVVCGVDPSRKRPEGCWYDLVNDAIRPLAQQEPADHGDAPVWRYRKQPDPAATIPPPPDKPRAEVPAPAPSWLAAKAKPDTDRPRAIKPSDANPDAPAELRRGDVGARTRAMERGNLVHRLLQSLPDVPNEHRAEAARAFLRRGSRAERLTDTERETIAREILALLDDARFAPLFADGSRAEVPIVGRLGTRAVPGGVVDRLAVTRDEVLIADYKTNRIALHSLAELQAAHPAYVSQLAVDRTLLRELYPDRTVRAALVWTDGPSLMEIPAEVLDSALARLTSP